MVEGSGRRSGDCASLERVGNRRGSHDPNGQPPGRRSDLIDNPEMVRFAGDEPGLVVMGTLGVLDREAELGSVSIFETIDTLRRTNVRVWLELVDTLSTKHGIE